MDAEKEHKTIVKWIRDWMTANGGKTVVLGVSGGKDSAICAALCIEAMGKENVICVSMPDTTDQQKIARDRKYIDMLSLAVGARIADVNISSVTDAFDKALSGVRRSEQSRINLPPRVRMTVLYAIAQSADCGRVCCTDNLSEWFTGYSTLWGDSVGDFAPLLSYTVTEVLAIGDVMGLPSEVVHRPPEDGLTGQTDEASMGFTYAEIDDVIRHGNTAELPKGKIKAIWKRARSVQFKHKILNVPCVDGALLAAMRSRLRSDMG